MSQNSEIVTLPEIIHDITNLEQLHPRLRANDWRSPLILRVLRSTVYEEVERGINVNYRNLQQANTRILRLVWQGLANDFARCINTYQEPVLTEYAALGLACVLISVCSQMEITEVTRRGERADYWLGNRECLLEVSGQQTGNLENLRDEKADQLRDNPHNLPGYVCVVVFDSLRSYLWFYEATNES